MEILDGRRDVSGGYKVDGTRGERVGRVSLPRPVIAMIEERLYIVAYDISDDRRWRRVFKLMGGYGRWLQLLGVSVSPHRTPKSRNGPPAR